MNAIAPFRFKKHGTLRGGYTLGTRSLYKLLPKKVAKLRDFLFRIDNGQWKVAGKIRKKTVATAGASVSAPLLDKRLE